MALSCSAHARMSGGAIAHRRSHVVLGKTLLFSFAEKSWKRVWKQGPLWQRVMLLSGKFIYDGLFYATWQGLWYFAGRLTPRWGNSYPSCCRLEGGRRREFRGKEREKAQLWIRDALVFISKRIYYSSRLYWKPSRWFRGIIKLFFFLSCPINAVNKNCSWVRESKWRRVGPSPRPCSWSYWVLLWAWTRVRQPVPVQKLQTGLNFWTAVGKRCLTLLWESQHGSLMCKSQAELSAVVVYMLWRLDCGGASRG